MRLKPFQRPVIEPVDQPSVGALFGAMLLSRFVTGSVMIVMAIPFVAEYLGK